MSNKRRGSSSSSSTPVTSAQEMVKLTGGKCGLIRIKEKKLFGTSWPRRFVITSRDTMFIFENETSKTFKKCIRLLGYNAVRRTECKDHDFSFSTVSGISSPTTNTIEFACLSDQDRRDWMQGIKQLLYKANGVDERPNSLRQRLQRLDDQGRGYSTPEEDEYLELEEPVFQPYSIEPAEHIPHPDHTDSGSDGSDSGFNSRRESTGSSGAVGGIEMRKSQIPPNIPNRPIRIASGPLSPLPPPPPCRRNCRSEEVPQYVNVRDSHEAEGDDYIYPPSLMEQCSVLHINDSREELLMRLATLIQGTYFIRKSRQSDLRILSIQCGERGTREIKIAQSDSGVSLDQRRWFPSTEELLMHYTLFEPIPGIPGQLQYLKRGILSAQDAEDEENPYSWAG